MSSDYATWMETALASAEAAAEVHAAHAKRGAIAHAREKGRADYVSETDFAAQDAALAVIRELHPDHGIMAEEEDGAVLGNDAPDAPLWVVDPLDGTTNFLHGHPMHCASVGLTVQGVPVAGAVVQAPTGDCWWAAEGLGAFKNGAPIQTSTLRSLDRALVGTGFPFKLESEAPRYARQLVEVLTHTGGIRRGGAAALDLCYLAEGVFDAFWELHLNPWDFAAGMVIVREAGGVMSRVDGGPLTLESGSVMGANSREMLEGLRRMVEPSGRSNESPAR